MIERTFLIRLPDLAEGLPQHFFRTVPWPDWREASDYQAIDEHFAVAVARREAFERNWDQYGGMPERLRHVLGYDRQESETKARIAHDPAYDYHAAWEFLRRNQGYQRDWATWSQARERAQGNEAAGRQRLDAEDAIRERYGIDTDFDKPTDPFTGGMPKFLKVAQAPTRKFRRSVQNYTSYLRVLDGLAAGVSRSEIAAVVFPGEGGKKRLERAVAVSRGLVDGGCREIATRHRDWLS